MFMTLQDLCILPCVHVMWKTFAILQETKLNIIAVVYWLTQLHDFIHQSLNSGSAQVLLQWSRLEIRLNVFHRSTISQKQFYIIIAFSRIFGTSNQRRIRNPVKHLR